MLRVITFLIALACACSVEDVETHAFESGSSSGSGSESSGSSGSESGEYSLDPGLALDPDVQRTCPDKWCAGPGYFVDCACSTQSPYEGTTICCNNPTNDRIMVGASCPAGKVTFSCRRDKPESEDPLFVPPTSCTNGFNFVCPGGYSAKPTDPAESGCVGVTVNEECTGSGPQTCASVC